MTDYDQAARLALQYALKTAESAGDDAWAKAVREELKQYGKSVKAEDVAFTEPDATPLVQADLEQAEAESAPEVKPSMALTKDELVNLAEAAGLGEREELEQFTKQELVDELNANEGEG